MSSTSKDNSVDEMKGNPFAPAPEPKSALGRLRILSSSAGIRVSPLQLGTMSIGNQQSAYFGGIEKDDAFALLDAFVAEGGNFIDTANHYQNEQSEEWIGEWAESRGIRDHLVLATKYTTDYRGWQLGKGVAACYHGNHKKSMHLSLNASLKKLRTTYLDIFYVHWWDYSTSVKEIMDSLHSIVESGKVLYLGISDTPAWLVAAANEYAVANGKTPFSVYQGCWNVMIRDFERDILPMARHYGMALAPWGVLGQGRFQTKKQLEERQAKGGRIRSLGIDQQTPEEEKVSAALEKITDELGEGYSISAVAIAYVMAKAPRVFPIIGGRKIEHLKDNIRGLEIRLTNEQIALLDSATSFSTGFPLTLIGNDPKVDGSRGAPLLAGSGFVDWLRAERPIGYS